MIATPRAPGAAPPLLSTPPSDVRETTESGRYPTWPDIVERMLLDGPAERVTCAESLLGPTALDAFVAIAAERRAATDARSLVSARV